MQRELMLRIVLHEHCVSPRGVLPLMRKNPSNSGSWCRWACLDNVFIVVSCPFFTMLSTLSLFL